MKLHKKYYLLGGFFILLFLFEATAHPLGNFSINQYSRLEVGESQIRVRQVLDLAEIPAFQESTAIDADKNGLLTQEELNAYAEKITPQILENLFLSINNQPLMLRVERKEIFLVSGAGGLSTLKVKWDLIADSLNHDEVNRVWFENKNYPERLGWREIVVTRQNGISVFDATVFGSGVTNELEAYPQNSLEEPLHEKSAEFSFTTKAAPVNARPLQNRDGHQTAAIQKDRLAELISLPEITLQVVLFGLVLAFGLGAMHAMSPGHGKTVVGAYLVGSRGTAKHAAFLGLTVTITHTLGVFALGLITLFASNFILPERIMPFLSFVSGLLVFFIGVSLFKDRLFGALGWKPTHHHSHIHAHQHGDEHFHTHDNETNEHTHDGLMHTHDGVHYHSHLPPEEISWKSLLGLGISGGLLPCPSALVLMLAAISLGRVGYGLILTLAFSLGLAATLVCVGLAFLYVGRIFDRPSLSGNRIIKTLPVLSAFVIACMGAVICYNSMR